MFMTFPNALGLEDMRDFDDLRVNIFYPKQMATVVRCYSQSVFLVVLASIDDFLQNSIAKRTCERKQHF